MGFIPSWRWDKVLSGMLASVPLTLTAGGLLEQWRLTFHRSVPLLYGFSPLPLSLQLALSFSALTFMCSYSLHTRNFTRLHYAVIKPVLNSLQSFIILLHGFIIRVFYCFFSFVFFSFSVWPCSEMAPVHFDRTVQGVYACRLAWATDGEKAKLCIVLTTQTSVLCFLWCTATLWPLLSVSPCCPCAVFPSWGHVSRGHIWWQASLPINCCCWINMCAAVSQCWHFTSKCPQLPKVGWL